MVKKYEAPELEVMLYPMESIITTSGLQGNNEGSGESGNYEDLFG